MTGGLFELYLPLSLGYQFTQNAYSIRRTLDVSNKFVGRLTVRDIESWLYTYWNSCNKTVVDNIINKQKTFKEIVYDKSILFLTSFRRLTRSMIVSTFTQCNILYYFLIHFVQTKITSFIFEKCSGIKGKHSSFSRVILAVINRVQAV